MIKLRDRGLSFADYVTARHPIDRYTPKRVLVRKPPNPVQSLKIYLLRVPGPVLLFKVCRSPKTRPEKISTGCSSKPAGPCPIRRRKHLSPSRSRDPKLCLTKSPLI